MKYFLLFLVSMNAAFAVDAGKLSVVKEIYSQKAYKVKVAEEKELLRILGKADVAESLSSKAGFDDDCVAWVYQGPSTREEAVQICRGVRSLECAQWVYQGPASRVEAIEACRGVHDIQCAQWVYQGPASRIEAVQACQGVRDMSCVEFVYQGPASRVEAAQTCGRGGGRPGRPDCN